MPEQTFAGAYRGAPITGDAERALRHIIRAR